MNVGSIVYGGHKSTTAKTFKLKILGGTETVEMPGTAQTTVGEMKEMVANMTLMEFDKIDMVCKVGAYMYKQKDTDLINTNTLVKGIKKFSPSKMEWPHPTAIIGQGYHGLKTAMTYLMSGDKNLICFDRFPTVGGYCWITGANKTSRLQTEFGSFHVWWGQDCIDSGLISYPDCGPGGWHIWPYKEEINRHFNHAADVFGVRPHCKFQSNVTKIEVVGGKNDEGRYYLMTYENLVDNTVETCKASSVYTYPGSLTRNRIIEYPGEDVFDGDIRYGMNDDTPYDKLKGNSCAILGQGAFAVENARTVLECEGTKAYIVTRRKNLASPRMASWFVHQGPMPTPGHFVLKMFEPMYEFANFGDPWQFWSVHSNSARNNVTILQNSRFGIGDVTFLMCAWGLLEFHVATVKRFAYHCLHLSNGDKIEDCSIVLKALGLLGDWSVDRMHGMKEMVGPFVSGDFRRPLMIDATGMNAANFTTFSTGIGTTDFTITKKYLMDYPKEFYKAESMGLMKSMPRHKEEPEVEKPAYLTDVKYSMTGGILIDNMVPALGFLKGSMSRYKYTMYHTAHSCTRAMEVAKQEWDKYQETWKARGIEHEYCPYPYSRGMVNQWFTDWSKLMNIDIHPDGPKAVPLRLPWE